MPKPSNPSSISCVAKALVDGVATTKHFLLSHVREEDDSDMLERALKRGRAALLMGADVVPQVRDLHVSFI